MLRQGARQIWTMGVVRPSGQAACRRGCWGDGEVRGKRFIFSCVVKTREGPEKIELVLTRTGFIFIPAEGFKAVVVKNGEFMQVAKDEARNMIKGADVDDEALGGKN